MVFVVKCVDSNRFISRIRCLLILLPTAVHWWNNVRSDKLYLLWKSFIENVVSVNWCVSTPHSFEAFHLVFLPLLVFAGAFLPPPVFAGSLSALANDFAFRENRLSVWYWNNDVVKIPMRSVSHFVMGKSLSILLCERVYPWTRVPILLCEQEFIREQEFIHDQECIHDQEFIRRSVQICGRLVVTRELHRFDVRDIEGCVGMWVRSGDQNLLASLSLL